ncbi:hypothetical protein GQX73_g9950 [Xylaria multiplex]|uniref:Reverse transcriptase domain-containing protein n=1 Tax=Xylaria multiplex TaxID=323545 RepID=A0A7C8IHI1_9PEZI|nr:hypothetical protein GQX73_g9950 [Xylaria multiplex]
MTGVGGTGPQITHDCQVSATFLMGDKATEEWTLTGGVVPDRTFPGDFTVGKRIFHEWGGCFDMIRGDETLRLTKFSGQPILRPLQHTHSSPATEIALMASDITIEWHKNTPTDSFAQACLKEYVAKFPGLFDSAKRRTDVVMKTKHYIDTGDHPPIRLPPRRYSPMQEKALREFVKAHLGIHVRKGFGPWGSPALLTPKKAPGETTKALKVKPEEVIWRFCCDYREVNKATKKRAHPLPNAGDQIQKAAGHSHYAFIDFKDGFWHIAVHEPDIEKTAFVTPFGLYEWLVMPFGLCNAPATFQAFIEEVLEPFRDWVAGLLDDICVWADSRGQLHKKLLLLFTRLVKYGVMINSRKTLLFVSEGVFLGFHISVAGIKADPAKVAAVRDRPMPKTTTEVRAFTNAAGYFRHLIGNYSLIAAPLTALTGGPKNQALTLSPEAKDAWQEIREAITTIPVVKSFNWKLPSVLETDSSQLHVGACLLQPHLHGESTALYPVAYFSKKLADAQTRYSSQERKLLAALLALQH